MRISFIPQIRFGENTKLSTKRKQVKKDDVIETEEIWNGRKYVSIKDKHTNKLIQTALLNNNDDMFIVTGFENGLPKYRVVFNDNQEMILYRKYNNGISDLLRVVNDDGSLGIPIENEDGEIIQEYFE